MNKKDCEELEFFYIQEMGINEGGNVKDWWKLQTFAMTGIFFEKIEKDGKDDWEEQAMIEKVVKLLFTNTKKNPE